MPARRIAAGRARKAGVEVPPPNGGAVAHMPTRRRANKTKTPAVHNSFASTIT
jgi:hypothetical protein